MFCGISTSARCSLVAAGLSLLRPDLLQFARPITPTNVMAVSPESVKQLVG